MNEANEVRASEAGKDRVYSLKEDPVSELANSLSRRAAVLSQLGTLMASALVIAYILLAAAIALPGRGDTLFAGLIAAALDALGLLGLIQHDAIERRAEATFRVLIDALEGDSMRGVSAESDSEGPFVSDRKPNEPLKARLAMREFAVSRGLPIAPDRLGKPIYLVVLLANLVGAAVTARSVLRY